MEESRNIHNELEILREEYTRVFSATEPTREFGATMFLAMLRLHMVESRLGKSNNLQERRRLINEFKSGKSAIEKGIQAFKRRSLGNHDFAQPGKREPMSRL